MNHYAKFILIISLTVSFGQAQEHPAFIVDRDNTLVPWSHLTARVSDGQFRFAVVPDRTGGMRRGVFEKAVAALNLLQPEFVMCVGDLIDGYTEYESLINEQWDEFNAIIAGLAMPFFYLPGNHDISNPTMQDHWNSRFGTSYYHFLYNDVLFLCLNTEDGKPSTIGPEQILYFRNTLESYPDPKWIFVFMHKPLWDYDDKGGFEKIGKLLEGKTYTLFSGHNHNYVYKEKNGNKHFVLATAGGSSRLRGAEFGEFDHVTWVTMNPDGPVIAHIEPDGMYDEKLVAEETYPMVEALRDGDWFTLVPVVHNSSSFMELDVTIRLNNTAGQKLRVMGQLPSTEDITFTPDQIEVTVDPGTVKEVPLKITSAGGSREIAGLKPVTVRLTGEYAVPERTPLSLASEKEVLLDWLHKCPVVTKSPFIDGDFNDWDRTSFIEVKQPQYLKEGWDWKGPDDGWFRFGVACGNDAVFLAVETMDDRLILEDSPVESVNQDKIYIQLDYGENDPGSLASIGEGSILDLECAPVPRTWDVHIYCKSGDVKGIDAKGASEMHNMRLEMRIPYARSETAQFRLNVGFMDHDNPGNTKPSVLWWRPLWDQAGNYPMSGTFITEPHP